MIVHAKKSSMRAGTSTRPVSSGMDDDDQELLRQLFAVATEITESAHDVAAEGQSGQLAARDYADLAHRLRTAAEKITALSEAAGVIAAQSAEQADPAP